MAIMIPKQPKEFDRASKEGIVFESLSKLSDDHYVFHSVSPVGVSQKKSLVEREIDFVVYNKSKGIICIEVKAGGGIEYKEGRWLYSNGIEMSHGGPYRQAQSAKYALINKLKANRNTQIANLANQIKFFHAVCFVDMMKNDFFKLEGLPTEASLELTITADDLIEPTSKIDQIYKINLNATENIYDKKELTPSESKLLIDGFFAPNFHLVQSPIARNTFINEEMIQLLREQYVILDFLEEQNTAVINGKAGTGKTFLATEKARRHSINGEKVLFLCYNKLLCEKLEYDYKKGETEVRSNFENVDFMTINKFIMKITNRFDDYEGFEEWLIGCYEDVNKFPYKHVIVDEGQDFGLIDNEVDNANNSSIINLIQENVLKLGGTFYLFYDKHQMIQGVNNLHLELPECISNSDCRLTLHKNCRNTLEIAKTSVTPLKDEKSKSIIANVASNWIQSPKPVIHFAQGEEEKEELDSIIDKLTSEGVKDIVILTLKNVQNSSLFDFLEKSNENDSYYFYSRKNRDYKFTTTKRFKGLEAEAVIVVDISKDSFEGKNALEFYVGTSRAKVNLELLCNIKDEDFEYVIKALDPSIRTNKRPDRLKKILSELLSTKIVV